MKRNIKRSRARRFWCFDLKVDDDRILAAAHNHRLARLVRSCIHFLMRHIWRNVDEISRARFAAELKAIAPAHASAALHDVQYGFQLAVVMRSRLCIGLNCDGAGPKLRGTRAGMCNAAARIIPGVCGVFGSSSFDRTILIP